MLQSFFEDRFKLKPHHEVKELPIYVFVVAKSGPRLSKTDTRPHKYRMRQQCGDAEPRRQADVIAGRPVNPDSHTKSQSSMRPE